MSDCFVLYLLLTCMKKKTSGADKFTNNTEVIAQKIKDTKRKDYLAKMTDEDYNEHEFSNLKSA